MKTSSAILLLSILLLAACKRGDETTNRLECPSEIKPLEAWLQGGFLLPNAFSPTGDGRNDVLRIVQTDSTVIRSMQLRISDAAGTLLYTITQPKQHWTGHDAANKRYADGQYRVDYDILMNGHGTTADSSVKGHTCIWLFGPHPTKPGCLKAPSDIAIIQKLVFEDQLDPRTLYHPYTTGEQFDF